MTQLTSPVVLIGVGEMGGVFAKALLRDGHAIVPVTRSTSTDQVADQIPEPLMVFVTVGEADLPHVLAKLPDAWADRVVLVQNELLPRDWEIQGIQDPTVAVVWFEKKRGTDTKVIIPTPVAGPMAPVLVNSLNASQIAATIVKRDEIVDELIIKNLYILVANIAGLVTGGTVGELWENHEHLAREVGNEVLAIQEYLVGRSIDSAKMYHGMLEAFAGDPNHGTTGRSAPLRLGRALTHAAEGHIAVPKLIELSQASGVVA
ncbi:MAG: hypothetical protein O3B42_07440 [Actinomycetota bacterium]|nr:hypothetical protein [Actinomycetota bacterium]